MWKRLSLLWMLVKGDAKRVWFAVRHPATPGWFRVGTVLVLVYLVSPFDLVPESIPFFGVIDDLVLVPTAIRWMLNRLPPDVRTDVDRRAGVGADGVTIAGR